MRAHLLQQQLNDTMREQHGGTAHALHAEVASLRSRLARSESACSRLQQRRAMDLEGFGNDIHTLRKALQARSGTRPLVVWGALSTHAMLRR